MPGRAKAGKRFGTRRRNGPSDAVEKLTTENTENTEKIGFVFSVFSVPSVVKFLKTIALVLFLAFGLALAYQSPPAKPPRAMAITIDDLPYASAGQPQFLPSAQRVTTEILRVLKAHRAPAVGFVVEAKLNAAGESEARAALLKQWVDAGAILGNHTYSHPDFNAQTVKQFQDEILRGEVITRRLMSVRKPYQLYFRHPMTHTGDTREKKEAIDKFLAARGYHIAPHTIENSDFIFNAAYVRARLNDDKALVKRLAETYLDYTTAVTNFAEQISPLVFRREIPQTLLIHANDITAGCLDEMLSRFEARGYRFIKLDEAMADAAYQTKDTHVSTHGPTWLFRWIKSLGMSVSFKGDPEPPQWVLDLYK